ncbi:hypothetical protein C0J52_22314 [Blattella germanica]|nr:hypothetical protein C0J52_22314 [Blattella germanica]
MAFIGSVPLNDDDDYNAGSGFSTTETIIDDDLRTVSTLLPTLESITHMLNLSISTTANSLHNLTGVKGANTHLVLYDVVVPAIGAIILLMNLAVVISSGLLLKGGAHPRTTYLFLGNVAMADLVTSVATLFGQLYPRTNRTEMICLIQLGMIVSSTLASIWSVLLIGIDRFLYIVRALQYQQMLSPFRARILIILTWILGIVIGFMPITGWIGDTGQGRYCWFIKLAPPELVLTTAIVGCLPIFIITALYSIILYHALRKVRQLQRADQEASVKHVPREDQAQQLRIFRGGQSVNGNDERAKTRQNPKKFRAVMVVGLTTGSFIISWVPFMIACILYVICMKTKDTNDCKGLAIAIASPLAILGFANSLLNPLIYAWWHKGFRTFFCQKILRRKTSKGTFSSNRRTTTSSNKTSRSSYQSNSSRPMSPRINTGVTEGPHTENEDTRL